MVIGVGTVDLFIPASRSLKEKRHVIKSVKDRIKNQFNVSVAEVDHQDKWQRATLGIAQVSEKQQYIDETFQKIFNLIDQQVEVQVINRVIDYY
jgi:hypothetical protein